MTNIIAALISVLGTALLGFVAWIIKRIIGEFDRVVKHVERMEYRLLKLEWELQGKRNPYEYIGPDGPFRDKETQSKVRRTESTDES